MIDSSIAMGYKPVQVENPMNQLAQMMQIRAAQSQYDVGQQGLNEKNKLNAFYTGALNPDGTIDRKKLLASVATGGLGSRIPDLQKGFLETDEAQGKVDKQKIEMVDLRSKQAKQYLTGIQTPEQLIAWHSGNHQDPILGPELTARGITLEKTTAAIMKEAQTPGGFEKLLNQSALGLEEFIKQNKPTYQTSNSGQVETTYALDGLGGAPRPVITTQKVMTPGEVATDQRTRSEGGLNRENARTIASQGVTYEQDSDGNFVALPSKVVPGQAIKGIPVGGSNGPLQGKPIALTEAQGNATNFAARMKSASTVLIPLENKGVTTGNVGTMAAASAWTNFLATPDGQKYNQAAKNWVSANLRKESGAAIPESEMAQEIKKYFGIPGDSKEALALKRQARAVAEEGMMVQAGPGAKTVQRTLEKTKTSTNAPETNAKGWALHTDANGNKAYVSPDGTQYEEAK